MSSIHLTSGKRTSGIKSFLGELRENPVIVAITILALFSIFSYFTPLGSFFVKHHQFFGVIAVVSAVPTALFIWVLYMKYGKLNDRICAGLYYTFNIFGFFHHLICFMQRKEDRIFMRKYNERVRKLKGEGNSKIA